ncbi:MAG: TrkH family potassium uptake protein [Nitratireductor sp.]|nr:TrkH family potassium uptake protein [Nitratireductor sp.]
MLQTIALIAALLGGLMLFPAVADFLAGNPDWQVFAVSAAAILFTGGLVYSAMRKLKTELELRQIFIFVPLIWFMACVIGAIPLFLSGLDLSLTDAFFESASGFTTTGSTVLTGLDHLPPGILLWRSMVQWIGGLGVVVMGLVLLPSMRSGGQQLFLLESSDRSEKPFAHARLFAERIAMVYLLLTLACAISYWMLGMSLFDAFNHAMTTVSTGGYSTSDGSMGSFGTTAILLTATVFMFLGGLPFIFLIRLAAGRFEKEVQIGYFIAMIAGAALAVLVTLILAGEPASGKQIVHVLFNVVSIITTTGYASEDYLTWGPAAIAVFFFLTFVGGCSGSTSGGYKQFRFVIVRQVIADSLAKTFRPHQVSRLKYGDRILDSEVVTSVMIFSFLYGGTFIIFAIIYGVLGLDFETAISGSATAIANVGPGIGSIIGPAGNFSTLSDPIKWMLCFEMIVGRLEIMSVYVLLLPGFWR